jgi:2-keto-4-pentenoate hydratase
MSTPAAEEAIAAELVAARREGRALPAYPGPIPADQAGAYRIQELAMAQWPDTLVGWKIGYIAPQRRAPGEPDRLIGPIWSGQCHAGAQQEIEVPVFVGGFAAVEAELVIRLSGDLPAHEGSWTAEEVAQLDQQLLYGIEVASSPVPDINSLGPAVVASDFGNNNGLVLGEVLPGGARVPVRLACTVDGELLGEGGADDLPRGIHAGLATALDVLAGRGRSVAAGTLFATGATTGIHEVGVGQHCRVEVRGGPSVELRTVAAR